MAQRPARGLVESRPRALFRPARGGPLVVVVDAEMHADQEAFLLESGSAQPDLWGINLYPDRYGEDDFIEYDSMINVRPSQGNRSRYVEDVLVRARIEALVARLAKAGKADVFSYVVQDFQDSPALLAWAMSIDCRSTCC